MFRFAGWRWVAKALLLAGLAGGVWWLGAKVLETRVEREVLTQTLTELPARVSAEVVQQAALSQHQTSVEQVQRLLPDQQAVGSVAGSLEQEGSRREVTVTLTDIAAVLEQDASGAPVTPTGPVGDIRISGSASGAPGQLLEWLGIVEGLPYVLRVEAWKLQVVVPTTLPVVPARPAAEIFFSLLLSVRHADQP